VKAVPPGGRMTTTWRLCEGETWYATVEAPDAAAALEIARDNVEASNYNDMDATIWIPIRVQCEATGDEDADTVRLDPPVPECSDRDGHDWQSPHERVGGLTENPGVFGHGGGVQIHEICASCERRRVTDTWATDPVTGRQGLESVSYPRAGVEVAS
jgi:hypothetical protein